MWNSDVYVLLYNTYENRDWNMFCDAPNHTDGLNVYPNNG